jgi:hypothetical protein
MEEIAMAKNERAKMKLRMHFRDRVSDWTPLPGVKMKDQQPTKDCGHDPAGNPVEDADTHHIIFHRDHYDWGEDEEGHLHVAAKRAEMARTTDDRISDGVEPETEARLREKQPERIKKLLTQADINKANAAFWTRK